MAFYATQVASSATSLFSDPNKDKNFKNIAAALCQAHVRPINYELKKYAINSLGAKVPRIINYGRDEYERGLPQGYSKGTFLFPADRNKIANIISSEVGEPVEVRQDTNLNFPDAMTFARYHAIKHWGYIYNLDFVDNPPIESESPSLSRPYLINAEIHRDGTLRCYFHVGYETIVINDDLDTEEIEVHKYYDVHPSKLDIVPDLTQDYYHAFYTLKNDGEMKTYIWIYQEGSGGHPELDIEVESTDTILPVIPIREYNKPMNHDSLLNTNLYKTSKHIVDKLYGSDFDQLCDSISDSPDANEIDHAYLVSAIDINTLSKEGKKYIYQFFYEEAYYNRSDKPKIGLRSSTYNTAITYDSVSLSTKNGKVRDRNNRLVDTYIYVSDNNLIINHKDTNTTYKQIVVRNLKHHNYIYNNYDVETSVKSAYLGWKWDSDKGEYVQRGDDRTSNFLLPIRYDLFKKDRGLFKRDELIKESLHIVANVLVREKLDWWAQFLPIIVMVGVIVFIWTGGAAVLIEGLSTALAGGLLSTLIFIGKLALTKYALGELSNWLVDELGVEWALALVAVISVAFAYGPDIIDLNFESLMSVDKLLAFTNNFLSYSTQFIKSEMEAIQKEMEDFKEYTEVKEEELEKLKDDIKVVDPWLLASMDLRVEHDQPLFETPEEFFNRTIHAGNVGPMVYQVIPTYVETKTSLPDPRKNRF